MTYRNKSYSDKLLIGINRAILFRQGSCRNSDDSSRDELIFRGSYADNAIPPSVLKNNSKRHRHRVSTARDCGSRDAYSLIVTRARRFQPFRDRQQAVALAVRRFCNIML